MPSPDPQKKEKKEELSEEDQALKDNIDNWVAAILEAHDPEALAKLDKEVRTATGTMTSLPRPFKFLFAHYKPLETFFAGYEGPMKVGPKF